MKIAITGAAGTVGRVLVAHALNCGHCVVGIDLINTASNPHQNEGYVFIQADLTDYDQVLSALTRCDAVVHLAAIRTPGDGKEKTHNNNVISSWNVLRAAAELGISRVAQASSINVIGLYWNQDPLQLDYLPLDEAHPCRPDDPYSLSKQICEAQADSIVRRFKDIRIASLRIHMVVPSRDRALHSSPNAARKNLWGYTLEKSCASAFLLALTADHSEFQRGHERFFVVEPEVASVEDVEVLIEREWKGVPIRGELKGRKGLFDCSKAERILGWKHG
ncbi:NAD-binding protein [Ramaria rubella]|nr:NAD-binding protein [Ramaria rubella]